MPVDRTHCKSCLFFDDDTGRCVVDCDWRPWTDYIEECHSYIYCSEEDRKKIVRMIRGKEVGG